MLRDVRPEEIAWLVLFAVGSVKSYGLLVRAHRRVEAIKVDGASVVYLRGLRFQEAVRFLGILAFALVGVLAVLDVRGAPVLALLFAGGVALVVNTFAADVFTDRMDEALGSHDEADVERGWRMTPTNRPTEWIAAIVGLAFAAFAYFTDRDVAAIAAAVLAFVPALVTAVAERFPKLARLRPTEVAAAVAGVVAAAILYSSNRDLAALFSAIQAVAPALVTGLVVASTPAPPTLEEPPADVDLGDVPVD